jgi:hypothetical protein
LGTGFLGEYLDKRGMKLHSEELHNLCSSPGIFTDQVKENEVGGACGMHAIGLKSIQGFCEKAQRKEITWMTEV